MISIEVLLEHKEVLNQNSLNKRPLTTWEKGLSLYEGFTI